MSGADCARATAALLVGAFLVGAEYWGLLNVPESSAPALALSATLALLMVITSGIAIGVASVCSQGLPTSDAVRRAIRALPLFVAGLIVFVALWRCTTSFDAWWFAHRGEADATVLRYMGFTKTAPFHTAIEWLSWLVRWAGGLSIVAGLVAVATLRGPGQFLKGLRVSLKAAPLAASVVGVVCATRILWTAAYWRPSRLPATSAEMYVAGGKLALLSVAAAVLAALIVSVYGRAATRS